MTFIKTMNDNKDKLLSEIIGSENRLRHSLLVRDSAVKTKADLLTDIEKVAKILADSIDAICKGHEIMAIALLNSENQFIGAEIVLEGAHDHINIRLRQIFSIALSRHYNAHSFILAHNHLSGDLSPSHEDLEFMGIVKREALKMDCPMRDFIITGYRSDGYYSHRHQTLDL